MFEKLLARLGAALDRHSIPYMIIGGQAVLLYGEPRLTRDIDVTLGIDLSSLDTLLAVVEVLEVPWTVSGSVNHFGHVHYRQNRYEASLHIIAVEDTWKITGIELIEEKRLL